MWVFIVAGHPLNLECVAWSSDLRRKTGEAEFCTRVPWPEEPPPDGDGYCLPSANQVQRSALLCQQKVRFWCCRVGSRGRSRGRTRGPGLVMILWILQQTNSSFSRAVTNSAVKSVLIQWIAQVFFASQASLPCTCAHSGYGFGDAWNEIQARCEIRAGKGNVQNYGVLVQAPSAIWWPHHSVEVSWPSPPSPVKPKDRNRIHLNVHLEVRCPEIQLPLQSLRALLEGGLFHFFSISVGMGWLSLWREPRQPL